MTSLPPHALWGIMALGIVLGPFPHGFHSSSPLLTSLEPSSTMTITTAVPFSSEETGLTLLPLPTLVHLLSLLFQVNQPPFLPSTHILQPVSSSSYHPLPSLHSKPTQSGSFLHHTRERFSPGTQLKSSSHLTFD